MESADYIVVGGGSAGAVLASRLSEDRQVTVLLVEAGGEADDFLVRMPAGFARMLNNSRYDWCYAEDPDPTIDNRKFIWSAGKMLGGSSSINGQVYIRGSVADHEHWVSRGCAGWSFEECLPFFRRAERFGGPASPFHGTEGPLSVIPMRDPHPLSTTFIRACAEVGIKTLEEYCGGNLTGAFLTLCNQFPGGTRCGTAQAHLRQARHRSNLRVLTRTVARSIVFSGQRATGVSLDLPSGSTVLTARREVIICAGAVGSPALLMRSGVGPARHLQDLQLRVVADRAAVGSDLQEHAAVPINKFVNVPTYNSQTGPVYMGLNTLKYFLLGKGPMVTPAVQAMAVAQTRPSKDEHNVQLHFLPLSYDIEPASTSASSGAMDKRPTVMISASTCRPFSRGTVRLHAPDAAIPPKISHTLLADPRDVDTLIGGCKLIERVFSAPAWSRIITAPRSPPAPFARDEEWIPYIRSHATICYHPVGTCRMGSDAESVVDPQLRVRGVEGLRIADASVLPTPPSVNTNATAIMIGERAADLIRAR